VLLKPLIIVFYNCLPVLAAFIFKSEHTYYTAYYCKYIKGKTNEKLGYLGRMEGIEAQAVVLLEKAVG